MVENLPEEEIIIKRRKGQMTIDVKLVVFNYTDEETGMRMVEVPSLNFSGYGDTQEEADEMLKNCVYEYFQTLCSYSVKNIKSELLKYGWAPKNLRTKVLRPNFNPVDKVEENGITNYETSPLSLTAA